MVEGVACHLFFTEQSASALLLMAHDGSAGAAINGSACVMLPDARLAIVSRMLWGSYMGYEC